MYLDGHEFNLRTDRQALTTLLATSGIGHKPLCLHRWANHLQQYNYHLQFTPGSDHVAADLLSHAVPSVSAARDSYQGEHDLIQRLHTPLQERVSLQELQDTLLASPIISQLSI